MRRQRWVERAWRLGRTWLTRTVAVPTLVVHVGGVAVFWVGLRVCIVVGSGVADWWPL